MKKHRRAQASVHRQDAAHLAVFRQRKNERARSYDEFLLELKRDGLLKRRSA